MVGGGRDGERKLVEVGKERDRWNKRERGRMEGKYKKKERGKRG